MWVVASVVAVITLTGCSIFVSVLGMTMMMVLMHSNTEGMRGAGADGDEI